MTALLRYGCSRGVYSSRKLQEACRERVDFMAVTGRQEPNFRTINTFRRRHLDALGELFGQIKEAKGFRKLLMRGLEKIRGEWDLLCTAHNIGKLYKALG